MPAASVDIVRLDAPPTIVLVPSTVMPSRNMIDPVAADGAVAVKVRAAPNVDGLRDDATVMGAVDPTPGVAGVI
jgi:hypothetical protein